VALVTRHLRAELLDDVGAVLGEGPLWDSRTEELSWVDILSGVVHVHDWHGERRSTYEVGGHVGAALPAVEDGWLLLTRDGFGFLDRAGLVSSLLVVDARPELRFNDAKCDPSGQALAGTMRYDEAAGSASLYRLEVGPIDDEGGGSTPTARVLRRDVGLSNGLGWSPAGDTLYFIDTSTRTVVRHPYSSDGDLGPPAEVVSIDPSLGLPDGMCVDHDGNLWVSLYGGGAVHCYRPDGQLDTVVSLPVSHTTSVTFGGPDGSRLFITTAGGSGTPQGTGAGGLWAVDPGVQGPPATPWRGSVRQFAPSAVHHVPVTHSSKGTSRE
jgi:sugar lactone lactonase YvrE